MLIIEKRQNEYFKHYGEPTYKWLTTEYGNFCKTFFKSAWIEKISKATFYNLNNKASKENETEMIIDGKTKKIKIIVFDNNDTKSGYKGVKNENL